MWWVCAIFCCDYACVQAMLLVGHTITIIVGVHALWLWPPTTPRLSLPFRPMLSCPWKNTMMRSGQHDWRRQAGHDGVTPVIPGQVLSTFNQPGRDLQGATQGQGSNLVWYRASPGSLWGFRQTFQATSQARSSQIFCLLKTREVRLTQRPEWVEPWPTATRQAWLTKNT